MGAPADFAIEERGETGAVLRFSGNLDITTIAALDKRLKAIDQPIGLIDMADTGHIDTVGAWVVYRLARDQRCEIVNLSESGSRLVEAVGRSDISDIEPPHRPNVVSRVLASVGEATMTALGSMLGMLGFFGALVRSLLSLHPIWARITRTSGNSLANSTRSAGRLFA